MESNLDEKQALAHGLRPSEAVATRDRICQIRHSRCWGKDKELGKMLVLSRKVGERIHVGENITVEIRRISGNRVTLALDAPRNVRILRGELERAAREFDGPGDASGNTAASTANGAKESNKKNEAYTVVSARVNVMRDLPSQNVDRDYAM